MNHKLLILLFALFCFGGCGSSVSRSYPLNDRDKTFNTFLEVVPAYYVNRTEGVLDSPKISDREVVFLYRYKQLINGNHTEQVSLKINAPQRNQSDGRITFPESWSVGAWFQKSGADPEIPAITKEIEQRMLEAIGK